MTCQFFEVIETVYTLLQWQSVKLKFYLVRPFVDIWSIASNYALPRILIQTLIIDDDKGEVRISSMLRAILSWSYAFERFVAVFNVMVTGDDPLPAYAVSSHRYSGEFNKVLQLACLAILQEISDNSKLPLLELSS